MNASVKKKDGKQILESSLRSVSTMLIRKINAVKVSQDESHPTEAFHEQSQ